MKKRWVIEVYDCGELIKIKKVTFVDALEYYDEVKEIDDLYCEVDNDKNIITFVEYKHNDMVAYKIYEDD